MNMFSGGEVGVKVIMELWKLLLDGKGMQDEWQKSVLIPIFKGRDIRYCYTYRG